MYIANKLASYIPFKCPIVCDVNNYVLWHELSKCAGSPSNRSTYFVGTHNPEELKFPRRTYSGGAHIPKEHISQRSILKKGKNEYLVSLQSFQKIAYFQIR